MLATVTEIARLPRILTLLAVCLPVLGCTEKQIAQMDAAARTGNTRVFSQVVATSLTAPLSVAVAGSPPSTARPAPRGLDFFQMLSRDPAEAASILNARRSSPDRTPPLSRLSSAEIAALTQDFSAAVTLAQQHLNRDAVLEALQALSVALNSGRTALHGAPDCLNAREGVDPVVCRNLFEVVPRFVVVGFAAFERAQPSLFRQAAIQFSQDELELIFSQCRARPGLQAEAEALYRQIVPRIAAANQQILANPESVFVPGQVTQQQTFVPRHLFGGGVISTPAQTPGRIEQRNRPIYPIPRPVASPIPVSECMDRARLSRSAGILTRGLDHFWFHDPMVNNIRISLERIDPRFAEFRFLVSWARHQRDYGAYGVIFGGEAPTYIREFPNLALRHR